MKQLFKTMLLVFLFSCAHVSTAQDIWIEYNSYGTTIIKWTDMDCVSDKRSWDGKPYEVRLKKAGTVSWGQAIYADYGFSGVFYNNLEPNQEYKVRVRYYGKRNDCKGLTHTRTLATSNFVYNYVPSVTTYPVNLSDDSRRLRHVSSGKCLYTYPAATVSSSRTHNWGCWNDENMSFIIEELSAPNEVRFKSEWMNLCLQPVNNQNGGEIGMGSCYSTDSIYKLEPVSTNQFRLKNKNNGKCIYGNNTNGDVVNQWGCYNNSEMNFIFDEY